MDWCTTNPAAEPPMGRIAIFLAITSVRKLLRLLYVQRKTERLEGSLLEAFAQSRVGMDSAGNVLQPSSHLYCERKGGRKFRHCRPDRLDAEHHMIVHPRDHPHETGLATQRHGATVGAEGELADLDLLPRGAGLLGRQARRDDLR